MKSLLFLRNNYQIATFLLTTVDKCPQHFESAHALRETLVATVLDCLAVIHGLFGQTPVKMAAQRLSFYLILLLHHFKHT